MGGHGELQLPPLSGEAVLSYNIYVPLDVLGAPPNIVVRLNGAIIDQFRASRNFTSREITVQGHGNAPNVLTFDTDRVITPAEKKLSGDTRTLGLRINSIDWMPLVR
jgi:hypothetical protein